MIHREPVVTAFYALFQDRCVNCGYVQFIDQLDLDACTHGQQTTAPHSLA